MLEAVKLPTGVANLGTSLSDVDRDTLTLKMNNVKTYVENKNIKYRMKQRGPEEDIASIGVGIEAAQLRWQN